MNITTTYLTTPKLILRGNQACHPVAARLPWAVAAAFLLWAVATRSPAMAVAAIAYLAVTRISIWRSLKPHSEPGHTATITIDDLEYRDHCSVATGVRRWSSFVGAKRVGEFWVLRFTGATPMYLPRSALDDAQAAASEEFLEEKARHRGSASAAPAEVVDPGGVRISSTFRSTPKDVVRGHRVAHRATTRFVWALAACALLVGLVFRYPPMALLGVVYACLPELMVRYGARRHRSGPETFTVTMTDDEYQMRSREHATARSWTSFAHARRIRDHWVLKAKGPGALVLPASALDEEETRAFEELLQAKGLLPPSDLAAE